ncbi:MAG: hypothetical protein IPI81_16485 [Flavobacteriales bacterium]|nr:hypothetical protein [Flavobacteriales bacterium]MCC6938318.1 hypothetical protein [Flavobacteriales bacterium]
MRTRSLTIIAALGLLVSGAQAQLPRIVVQGSGAPQAFTDFAAAVSAAQSGDFIYLSGGSFTYPATLLIDKTLHIIGAGIHPDSTLVTGVTSLQQTGGTGTTPMRIMTAASGSTFTGIRFVSVGAAQGNYALMFGTTDANDDPADLVFQRCWFQGRVDLGFSESNVIPATTAFDECVFMGVLDGKSRSAVLTRCIIANGYATITLSHLAGPSTLENCVVLGTIQNNSGVTIRNSWLRTVGSYAAYDCANCIFQNNLTPSATVASASLGAVELNNIINVDPASVFVSETDGNYELTDDLHMAPGSPGISYSTDGTDMGIHGTSSPNKPGAVPFNPHFRQATIAPSTNNNGALPVNIRVAAQTH